MTESTNEERIKRARATLKYQGEASLYDEDIIDVITDLLHLAKSEGLNTDMIMRCAQMHFDDEVISEEEDPDETCTEDTDTVFVVGTPV